MRAQDERQAVLVLQVDVERVLHRARRMVLGIVERGEVVPVGLDLRAVGDLEAERMPDFLDALPGAQHRVDAAAAAPAPGQRDIERLFRQARGKLRVGKRRAPRFERRLDSLLRRVERGARDSFLFRRKRSQCGPETGQLPALSEVACLCVFERRRVARRAEVGGRARNDVLERLQLQWVRLAFTWLAIFANAGLSMTARSASTLRSISIWARLSPAMKLE